jgi:ribonucrease Y
MNWILIVVEVILILVALAAGITIGYLFKQNQVEKERLGQRDEAERILKTAQDKAQEIEIKARDEAIEIHQKAENELIRRRNELSREEDRLQKRREELDARLDRVEKREQALNKRQSIMDKRANEIDRLHAQQMEELQRIAEMNTEQARDLLLAEVEKTARSDMARIIRQVEYEAREEGENKARKIISAAIQRVASEQVGEITTNTVEIPSEEMKGRIIGRNGRNIHALRSRLQASM